MVVAVPLDQEDSTDGRSGKQRKLLKIIQGSIGSSVGHSGRQQASHQVKWWCQDASRRSDYAIDPSWICCVLPTQSVHERPNNERR